MKRLAIVSGASRGIGLATAERFLAEGYTVYSLSRSAPANPAVRHLAVDFASAAWQDVVSEQLGAEWQAAEQICVVHNAAVLDKDSARDVVADRFAEVLQLNVLVPSQLNQLVLPYMQAGSSVVYVGSTLSRKAVANSCSYVTSKHALLGLMRATAQDLQGSGVHTCMVLPGFTETEMLREHVGNDDSILAALAETVLLGRLAQPQEIAEVVYFSSQNPALNGAEIDANLGQVEN